MSFEITTLRASTMSGVTVHHTFIKQRAESSKLLVIMPGRGYTSEQPVLYYLRRAAVDLGYDVLSLTYSFQVAPETFNMMNLPVEVADALDLVNVEGYQRAVFAGKSLGTPLAFSQLSHYSVPDRRLLLLTPIGDITDDPGDIPTLAIIGTADRYYSPELVKKSPANVQWKVFDGLSHALEDRHDWVNSIRALGEITAACAEFLK
jgi:pimeloyl-ACP methyl ester carboxylesterase